LSALLGRLTARLKLKRRLPENSGITKGCAVPEGDRAYGKFHSFNGLSRLLLPIPARRYSVEDDKNWLRAGHSDKFSVRHEAHRCLSLQVRLAKCRPNTCHTESWAHAGNGVG
jgi:hypothetical protein